MGLQAALLILGAILGVFVLILHFYGDKIEQLWQQRSIKINEPSASNLRRNLENEPNFDISNEVDLAKLDQPVLTQPQPHKNTTGEKFDANGVENLQGIEKPPVVSKSVSAGKIDKESQARESNSPKQNESDEISKQLGSKVQPGDQEDSSTMTQKTSKQQPDQAFGSLRQIDYWIKLMPSRTHTASELVTLWQQREDIQFPVQLHALTKDKPRWVDVFDAPSIIILTDIVASYQLIVDGKVPPLSDIMEFEQHTKNLSQTLDAQFQPMAKPRQAWSQAQKLHTFYKRHHKPIEATICAPDGQVFLGKLVETSAKQQGLDFHDGAYLRIKQVGKRKVVLYYLLCNDGASFDKDASSDAQIQSVRFSMLPALSENPGRDAREMLDAVKAFASRVNGRIRIPGKDAYHQEQLLNLRNHVSKLEGEMIGEGLDPGGPEILRIFS